jgi:hypothetical protein
MYTQLLDAALEARATSTSGDSDALESLFAEALRCRRQLVAAASAGTDGDRTSAVLAHQVSYDISLMDLARSVGIVCNPNEFDRPEQQRRKLEQTLESRGIDLVQTEESTPSTR